MNQETRYHNLMSAFHLKPLEAPIFITRPRMPSREAYNEKLDALWDSRWLTNKGKFHQDLEGALKDFVGEGEVTLVANGTLSLLLALKVADIERGGSIVTTPFTFPATTHAIEWLGCRPIFADIDPLSGNIDPASVAGRIEQDTKAVLAVHVYGTPCDDAALQQVCQPRNIPIIYDAAHAFAVEYQGKSLLTYGRAASTSFHATKLFSTAEGGAVFAPYAEDKVMMDRMRNFGIVSEAEIASTGLNMKMSEFHAAFGLLTFEQLQTEIADRAKIAKQYIDAFEPMQGIEVITRGEGFRPNWSYFAIRVKHAQAGFTRDELRDFLKLLNINCRRYFRPLTSRVPHYHKEPTAQDECVPHAVVLEKEVLCLPIYGELEKEQVDLTIRAVNALSQE